MSEGILGGIREAPAPALETACEAGIRRKLLQLAVALHAKHYSDAVQWRPFEDAYGLIDQIDNMAAGLSRCETNPSEFDPAEIVRTALDTAMATLEASGCKSDIESTDPGDALLAYLEDMRDGLPDGPRQAIARAVSL